MKRKPGPVARCGPDMLCALSVRPMNVEEMRQHTGTTWSARTVSRAIEGLLREGLIELDSITPRSECGARGPQPWRYRLVEPMTLAAK